MNAKEAAIDLIKYYVLRGDSYDSLRLSHMGSSGDGYSACIGGYVWKGDKMVYKGKNEEVIVTKLNKKECCFVFKLKKLYDEILSRQINLPLD